MILFLQREPIIGPACHGHLSIDDHPAMFVTIENAAKRIPEGRYGFAIYYSTRNHRMVPLILNVPNRTYIEIHPGNSYKDVEGCIAVGLDRVGDEIRSSVAAFEALMKLLREQLRVHPHETWLDIRDGAVAA